MSFLLLTEGSLVNKRDLLDLYLSGTYCQKTGTRPPRCVTPLQPTIFHPWSTTNLPVQLELARFPNEWPLSSWPIWPLWRPCLPSHSSQLVKGTSDDLSWGQGRHTCRGSNCSARTANATSCQPCRHLKQAMISFCCCWFAPPLTRPHEWWRDQQVT